MDLSSVIMQLAKKIEDDLEEELMFNNATGRLLPVNRKWEPGELYHFCRYERPDQFEYLTGIEIETFDRTFRDLKAELEKPRHGNRNHKTKMSNEYRFFMFCTIMRQSRTVRDSQTSFGCHKNTANRDVNFIARVFSRRFRDCVSWYTAAEKAMFGNMHSVFNMTLGAADCTLIERPKPKFADKRWFRPDKKKNAFNNFNVVDWLGICRFSQGGYRAGMHDRMAYLSTELGQNTVAMLGAYKLLADDGFFAGDSSEFICPYKKNEVKNDLFYPDKEMYNRVHKQGRMVVEQFYCNLKQWKMMRKFRYHAKNYEPLYDSSVILTNIKQILQRTIRSNPDPGNTLEKEQLLDDLLGIN